MLVVNGADASGSLRRQASVDKASGWCGAIGHTTPQRIRSQSFGLRLQHRGQSERCSSVPLGKRNRYCRVPNDRGRSILGDNDVFRNGGHGMAMESATHSTVLLGMASQADKRNRLYTLFGQ